MTNITPRKEQLKPTKVVQAKVQAETMAERLLNFELAGFLVLLALMGYYVGSPLAAKCLLISYELGPNAYDKGYNDLYFVGFWVVAFTFLRAVIMKYFFHPVGRLVGMAPFNKRQRFAEQGYMFTYCSIFWTWGMYLMYNGPYWFNTAHYWIDYPHIEMTSSMKSYYLMQMAFWFQQLYVLHIEKRRKDHVAMLSHHFITITLLVSSYCSNFTRIGNAVLCSTDLCDILLSFAKILKYLNVTTLCDFMFACFAIAWPITRHGFFSVIVWATAFEPTKYLDMKWEPEKGKYFTPFAQKLYLILLLSLNAIMFYWFVMIVQVMVRVIRGGGAEDTRSDDEDDEDDVDSKKKQ